MSPTSSPAMSSATRRASTVLSPLRRAPSHSGRVFRCLVATSSSSVLRCFCRSGGCGRRHAPRADHSLLPPLCSGHVNKPRVSGSSSGRGTYRAPEPIRPERAFRRTPNHVSMTPELRHLSGDYVALLHSISLLGFRLALGGATRGRCRTAEQDPPLPAARQAALTSRYSFEGLRPMFLPVGHCPDSHHWQLASRVARSPSIQVPERLVAEKPTDRSRNQRRD